MALDDLDVGNLNSAIEELRQILQQLGPKLIEFGKATDESTVETKKGNSGQRKLASSLRPYQEELNKAQLIYKEQYRQQIQLVSATRGLGEGILKDIILNNQRRTVANAELNVAQTKLKQAQEEYAISVSKLTQERQLLGSLSKNTQAYIDQQKRVQEVSQQSQQFADSLLNASAELTNAQIGRLSAAVTMFTSGIGKTGSFLQGFGDGLRDFERRVGVSGKQLLGMFTGGSAGFSKLMNLTKNKWMEMIGARGQDYFDRAIEARDAFGEEFGGTLTGAAASKLAMQARGLGLTAQELAKARRAFMTQTGNDVKGAVDAQNKFVAEFKKKGLNTKDAMQEIAKNSDIMARNGTRFAQSFAKAAADAKKIGVDLKKVDAFGDSIISDYEGFLEKQSELGAMGFSFDSSKLAEVAESGDTGALMGELRSQLAAQGKDLTNLRRSEQLALSNAFGIPMEELMRMSQGIGDEQSSSGERTATGVERLDKSVLNQTTEISALGKLLTLLGGGVDKVFGLLTAWKALVASSDRNALAKKLAEEATKTTPKLLDRVKGSLGDAFKSIRNVFTTRTPMGPALPPGFAGKETSAASAPSIRAALLPAIKGTLNDLRSLGGGVGEEMKKLFAGSGEAIKSKFINMTSAISTQFNRAFGPQLATAQHIVWRNWNNTVDSVKTGFSKMVTTVGEKFTPLVENVKNGFNAASTKVADMFSTASTNATNFVSSAITSATEKVSSVGESISEKFSPTIDTIKEKFGQVSESISGKFGEVSESLKNKFGPTVEQIKNRFSQTATQTRMYFSQASDSIKLRWAPVADAVKTRMSIVADTVKSKFTALFPTMERQSGGFFSRLASKVSSIGGSAVGKLGGIGGRAMGMVSGAVGRIGRFGASLPGIASLGMAGITSGMNAYQEAKDKGKSTDEAAGMATVQGGAAAAGAILGGALLPFLGPIGPMVGGFLGNSLGKSINEKFPGVAKNVGQFFTDFKSSFSAGFEKLKEKLSAASAMFEPVRQAFAGIAATFGKLFGSAEEAGKGVDSLGTSLGGGLMNALMWIIDNVLPPLVTGFTFFIDIVRSVLDFALPLIKDFFGGLKDGIVSGLTPLKEAFERVKTKLEPVKEAFERVKEAFSGFMSMLGGLFGSTEDAAGGAKGLGETLGGGLMSAMTWMLDNVLPPLISIFTFLVDVLASVIKVLTPIVKFLMPILVEVFKFAWDIMSGAFKLLGSAIEKVVPFITKLISLIGSIVSTVVDMIKTAGEFGGKVLKFFGIPTGEDVVSKSGYGARTLITPSGPIALNNNDNIVAYADDMIASDGVRLLSKGALANQGKPSQNVNVTVDMARLEQKLDAVVRAIGGMQVNLDGNRVGRVLVTNAEAGAQVGVMGIQSRTSY